MKYARISESSLGWYGKDHHLDRTSTMRAWPTVLLGFLLFSTGLLAGRFTLNQQCQSKPGSSFNLLDLPNTNTIFQYDRSFSYPPSNSTNSAWRDMFPGQGGFFRHPQLAPTKSTFSVFHQLHCVDVLRQGYFKNHEAASQGIKLDEGDIEEHIRLPHIRHCIDLLRQSLRCHADTTIEVWDLVKRGALGFGTEHRCGNWDQLLNWVAQQQEAYPYE